MVEIFLFLCTTSDSSEAREIGKQLVDEKLVACVNIVSMIESIYRWKGKVEEESEALLFGKTTRKNLDVLISRVKELHSYETPEILAFEASKGLPDYLKWVENNVK